jgi:PAS domain S-box-containing protein
VQIKRAFLVSILVVGIVLSAAVFVGFQGYKDTLYEHEQQGVDHTAAHVASALETQLSSLQRTVSIAATNPEVAAHGSAEQRRALETFVERSEFAGVSVIAANGTMTNIVSNVSAERRAALVGSDFSDRTYFKRALNGTTYVSDPVEADSGNHIITVSTPIYRDGRVVGTMNAAFHLSEEEFFGSLATGLEADQRLALYGRNGTPIYATGPAVSTEFERDITVQEIGWTVSVREGPGSVQSTIRTVTFVQVGSITAVLAILAAFGWRLYRLSIAQLSRLLGGFRRLEDGQYGTRIELHDSEEWQQVETGFNRLSDAIETARSERIARERELRRERDRFEALFEGVPEPVVAVEITDEATILRDANEAFETTFGYAVEDVAGEDVNDLIVPEDASAVAEAEAVDERAAAGAQITRQVRREARDGVREFLFRSAPIDGDADDLSRQFGVYVDITDRNEYETRLREQRDNLDTLNQVLRHDVRNDLQLVTAYADLLSDLCEKRDAGEESEERAYLRKITESAAHAVELTETARNMADVMLADETERRPMRLRTALESELENLRTETDAAVVTEGTIPDVTVSANDILGSVFRNLLTNAVQHNDTDVPEVRVSATVDGDVVRVRVADNGPGIPDSRKEQIFGKGEKGLESGGTGLGLYLVQALVDTYGGDVWVEDRESSPSGGSGEDSGDDPEGAVFVVELPLAE